MPSGAGSLGQKTKGKDLFDSMIWRDHTSTAVFYKFIASLRKTIHNDIRKTSPTHRFIRTMRDQRRLVRCYTQNIDGLEEREGLSNDLVMGKGNRARFTKKAMERPMSSPSSLLHQRLDGGCEVVQLHGDLAKLRCTLCQRTCDWNTSIHDRRLLNGRAPRCISCDATNQSRQDRGKRGTKVGSLRPNIVLYGEEHPSADAIGDITTHDLSLSPDLLLILGTSLHVHGLKTLVKEFAKAVHSRPKKRGKVIFVNLTKPAESVWKDVIDCWVGMDCDHWVEKMRRCRLDIWQMQGQLSLPMKKAGLPNLSKKKEADKENDILETRKPIPSPSSVKVVIKTPQKQRKPLGESDKVSAVPFSMVKARSRVVHDSNPSSSLPTPPPSGRSSPMATSGKKRKFGSQISEHAHTPSKRRQVIKIWED